MTAPVAAWLRCALGGAGGMFAAMGLGRFSYAAMVPALVEAGYVSSIEAGLVGTANLAGFFVGAVASVPLARRLGRGPVLRAALVVCLAGLAASALPFGAVWLACWRGLIGVATSLIMVLSLALIAETAPVDRRPIAAGFVFAGVGLGISASGIAIPALLAHGLAAAWTGVLGAGLLAAVLAYWGWRADPAARQPANATAMAVPSRRPRIASPALVGLMAAHALFSFSIVPHTIYWVDYIARGMALGSGIGGLHWSLVGIAAILGPLLTAMLARAIGTAAALVASFAILALGIAAPALSPSAAVLVASSLIFGAQPGVSSLMAARARDIGDPAEMPRVMRAMILSNATGGVIGGLIAPWIYAGAFAAVAGPAVLFAVGASAAALGALACWPIGPRRAA